jgi:hypothetical protein
MQRDLVLSGFINDQPVALPAAQLGLMVRIPALHYNHAQARI